MKKLALLTATLLASASVLADVSVQVTLKNQDQEFVSEAVILTAENPSAVVTVNEQALTVVLAQENPCIINVFDGQELVIASEFSQVPGVISLSNEDGAKFSAITITVNPVE